MRDHFRTPFALSDQFYPFAVNRFFLLISFQAARSGGIHLDHHLFSQLSLTDVSSKDVLSIKHTSPTLGSAGLAVTNV